MTVKPKNYITATVVVACDYNTVFITPIVFLRHYDQTQLIAAFTYSTVDFNTSGTCLSLPVATACSI